MDFASQWPDLSGDFDAYGLEMIQQLWDEVIDSVADNEAKQSLRRILEGRTEELARRLDEADGKIAEYDAWERNNRREEIGDLVEASEEDFDKEREAILEQAAPPLDYDLSDFFEGLAEEISRALTLEDQVLLVENLADKFDREARRTKLAPVMNDPWGVDDEDWVPDEFVEDIDYGEGDEVTDEDYPAELDQGRRRLDEELTEVEVANAMMDVVSDRRQEQDIEWQREYEHFAPEYFFERKMHDAFPEGVPDGWKIGYVLDGTPFGSNSRQDRLKLQRGLIRALLQSVETLAIELGEMTV